MTSEETERVQERIEEMTDTLIDYFGGSDWEEFLRIYNFAMGTDHTVEELKKE